MPHLTRRYMRFWHARIVFLWQFLYSRNKSARPLVASRFIEKITIGPWSPTFIIHDSFCKKIIWSLIYALLISVMRLKHKYEKYERYVFRKCPRVTRGPCTLQLRFERETRMGFANIRAARVCSRQLIELYRKVDVMKTTTTTMTIMNHRCKRSTLNAPQYEITLRCAISLVDRQVERDLGK